MSRRHVETITDYLIVAISPTLIIFLVGSLVFFLTHLFYDGDFHGRLRFASALFVMAAVLIARISIEEGREYASVFALPLSIVTILSMLKYTDASLLIVLPLVAFVWWSTDKLTWDCTVIDDHKDTSGKGLLQTVGIDDATTLDDEATTDGEQAKAVTLWQRWLSHRRRHHTPGVWVLYFGLIGILVFGLGQLLLPGAARPIGFLLLCIYVASALSLLMTTSFLQMRRYLVQRKLPFTDQMASTWLGTGGILIVGLMLLAFCLPRPHTGYSLLESFERVRSREEQRASRYAVGKEGIRDDDQEGRGDSDGEPSRSESSQGRQQSDEANASRRSEEGEPSQEDDGQDQPKSGDSQADESSRSNSKSNDSSESEDSRETNDSRESEDSNQSRSSRPERTPEGEHEASSHDATERAASESTTSSPPESNLIPPSLTQLTFGNMAKWLYFLLMAAGILFVLIRYGREIGAALQSLMQAWRDFLQRLFGGRRRASDDEEEAGQLQLEASIKPFSSYQDPFLMGTEGQFTPQQLVSYTFEALQAWAQERNCGRTEEQTPLEFATNISLEHQQVGKLAQNLAILYNQAAYAPGSLGGDVNQHLQSLWRALRRPVERDPAAV